MDAFDDLLGANQPTDPELEHALRTMLVRREADITEPGRLEFDDDEPVTPISRRFGETAPGGLLVSLLAAAAVVLLVAGSLFAVHGLRHTARPATHRATPAPAPKPTGTPSAMPSCPIPPSWIARITAGTITVDQPLNQPVSAGSDGTFLMMQNAVGQAAGQTDFTHQELAIFDRAGHGTTIWQAADPAHDLVSTSPDSAISAHWVVFGLTRSQNLADHGVVAWNRATGQATTVRLLSSAEESANTVIDMSPIVVGDTAYWIEHNFSDRTHQTLVAQPLPGGTRSTSQVSKVDRLVAVGGGVALLHDGDAAAGSTQGIATTLTAGPGLAIPASVQRAATGSRFSSDGTTLRWLSGSPGAELVRSWQPGRQLSQHSVVNAAPAPVLVGQFLAGDGTDSVLDTRNGAHVQLPAGMSFALATDGDLIVSIGTSKFGGSEVSRVAISALVPTAC